MSAENMAVTSISEHASDKENSIHQQLALLKSKLSLAELPVEGRLQRSSGLTLEAIGCEAALGDRCVISVSDTRQLEAEVVGFDAHRTLLMPIDSVTGLRPGATVRRKSSGFDVPLGNGLLGRVIDANAQPLDSLGPLQCSLASHDCSQAINPMDRRAIDEPFDVGVRSINGLLTLGRGQRVGLFAGSGVGKSALLGMMTKYSEADVTVIAMIGERGREVQEFVTDTLGPDGLKTAVVVAVPADQPPLSRLQGAALATAIAENFRDAGKDVLLLVDSLSRYAQAQREIGLAVGEPPTTKGYPPSVFALLPRLLERAGRFRHGGSITGIYTVLAEGDDQDDPIVDAARAVLDGHIVLSRTLSDAAHFPAVDIGMSVSRTLRSVASKEHQRLIRQCLQLNASYRSAEDMIRVGLYKPGTDPLLDKAVILWPQLSQFLQQDIDEAASLPDSVQQLSALLDEAVN